MIFFIVIGFIILDVVTGLVKSFKNHSYDSSIMREGLINKIGEILLLILGIGVDKSLPYFEINIGFSMLYTSATYLIIMNIGSIIENMGAISPKLVPEKIKKYFKKLETEDLKNE